MKIILKNNSKLEQITKRVLLYFIKEYNPPCWIKRVVVDEKAKRSYSHPTYIIMAVKMDWSPMAMCENFIHEQFHYYAQHLDEKIIANFLVYIKKKYKWNVYEFTDFNNFTEHLCVCYNTIKFMRKYMNSTDEFLADGSIYKTFVWFIINNWERVTNDLKKFHAIYK